MMPKVEITKGNAELFGEGGRERWMGKNICNARDREGYYIYKERLEINNKWFNTPAEEALYFQVLTRHFRLTCCLL